MKKVIYIVAIIIAIFFLYFADKIISKRLILNLVDNFSQSIINKDTTKFKTYFINNPILIHNKKEFKISSVNNLMNYKTGNFKGMYLSSGYENYENNNIFTKQSDIICWAADGELYFSFEFKRKINGDFLISKIITKGNEQDFKKVFNF